MRLRQLVIVAEERDSIASQICKVFDLKVAFHDDGLIYFGLINSLIPLGDTFIEIVTPVKENTTAERYLKRRNGNGGYMVIVDCDDVDKEKKRVAQEGIEVVYESERSEGNVTGRTIHLHPKNIGGAIVSIDKMNPESGWLWAGLEWQKFVSKDDNTKCLSGVVMQSDDKEALCSKWEKAFGIKANENLEIAFSDSRIKFIDASDGRGEGINAFEVSVKDKEIILNKARELELLKEDNIHIGGVNFILN